MRPILTATLVLLIAFFGIAHAEIPPALAPLNVRASEFPAALENFTATAAAENLSLRDAFYLVGVCGAAAPSLCRVESSFSYPRYQTANFGYPPQFVRGRSAIREIAWKKAKVSNIDDVIALTQDFAGAPFVDAPVMKESPHFVDASATKASVMKDSALILDAVATTAPPITHWEVREWLILRDLEVAVARLKQLHPLPKFPEPRPLDPKLVDGLNPDLRRAVTTFVRLTAPCITADPATQPAVMRDEQNLDWNTLRALYAKDATAAITAQVETHRSNRMFSGGPLFGNRIELLESTQTRVLIELLNAKQWEQAVGYILLTNPNVSGHATTLPTMLLCSEILEALSPDWEFAALGGEVLGEAFCNLKDYLQLASGFHLWRLSAHSPEVIRADIRWQSSKRFSGSLDYALRQYLGVFDEGPRLQRAQPLSPEMERELASKFLDSIPANCTTTVAKGAIPVLGSVDTPEVRSRLRELTKHRSANVANLAARALINFGEASPLREAEKPIQFRCTLDYLPVANREGYWSLSAKTFGGTTARNGGMKTDADGNLQIERDAFHDFPNATLSVHFRDTGTRGTIPLAFQVNLKEPTSERIELTATSTRPKLTLVSPPAVAIEGYEITLKHESRPEISPGYILEQRTFSGIGTDFELPQTQTGTYRISIEVPGMVRWEQQVEVVPEETRVIAKIQAGTKVVFEMPGSESDSFLELWRDGKSFPLEQSPDPSAFPRNPADNTAPALRPGAKWSKPLAPGNYKLRRPSASDLVKAGKIEELSASAYSKTRLEKSFTISPASGNVIDIGLLVPVKE